MALVALAALPLVLDRAASRAEERPAPVSGERPGSPLAGVTLEDADGRAWQLDEVAGQAVLVVVADRSASREAVAWGRALGAARPQHVALWAEPGKVVIVSIADLRGVPAFARGVARLAISAVLEERTSDEGPPLLLDWEGAVSDRVAARPGTPNVLLYAADGSLVLRDEGDATPDKLERLAAAVDRTVASEPTPPSGTPTSAEQPSAAPASAASPSPENAP